MRFIVSITKAAAEQYAKSQSETAAAHPRRKRRGIRGAAA